MVTSGPNWEINGIKTSPDFRSLSIFLVGPVENPITRRGWESLAWSFVGGGERKNWIIRRILLLRSTNCTCSGIHACQGHPVMLVVGGTSQPARARNWEMIAFLLTTKGVNIRFDNLINSFIPGSCVVVGVVVVELYCMHGKLAYCERLGHIGCEHF